MRSYIGNQSPYIEDYWRESMGPDTKVSGSVWREELEFEVLIITVLYTRIVNMGAYT